MKIVYNKILTIIIILAVLFFHKKVITCVIFFYGLAFLEGIFKLKTMRGSMNTVWRLDDPLNYSRSITLSVIVFNYFNFISFTMMYVKLSFNWKCLLSLSNLKQFAISLCFVLVDFPRIIYKTILFISKKDDMSFRNYLWVNLPHSSNVIYFFSDEQKFVLNGSRAQAIQALENFTVVKGMNMVQKLSFSKKINNLHKISSNFNQKYEMTGTYLYKNKKFHEANLELSKSEKNISMYSDYRKAVKSSFYQKETTLDCFKGDYKLTSALETHLNEVTLTDVKYKKTMIKEWEGAIRWGFNKELLSQKAIDAIGSYKEFDEKFLQIIEEFDLNTNEKSIIRKILFSHPTGDLNWW